MPRHTNAGEVAQPAAGVQTEDLRDRLLAWLTLALLRLARRCSLLRPRRPGHTWPGRGHALLCATLLDAERALDGPWHPAASLRLDRTIALMDRR